MLFPLHFNLISAVLKKTRCSALSRHCLVKIPSDFKHSQVPEVKTLPFVGNCDKQF